MAKIRILLIEDNPILCNGITVMLNGQPDFQVVGTIGSGNNILTKVKTTKPHLVLLDVGLKNLNEIAVVVSLRKNIPKVKVIGMGFVPTQSDIVEFVEAGAEGFILKNATTKEFIATVRAVSQGMKILPPPLTDSLFTHVVEIALSKSKEPKNASATIAKAVRMTSREREIIALISDGMSNKQIAGKLNIATFTVKSHVHNILEKLALHSRLQIALRAKEENSI